MFKKRSASILLSVVGLSLPIIAKGEIIFDGKGNGGNAVVCTNAAGDITSAELYDYFESRANQWGFEIDFGKDTPTYVEKVNYALQRLKPRDPNFVDALTKEFEIFRNSQLLLKEGQLNNIPDTDPDILPPEGCKFVQLAVRREPQVPQDKTYKILERVWNKLDETNRAGLALHEIIYQQARLAGHETSQFARYINNSISSRNGFSSVSPKTYLEYMQKAKMPRKNFACNGFLLQADFLEFFPSGQCSQGKLLGQQEMSINSDLKNKLKVEGSIYFHESGGTKEVTLVGTEQQVKIKSIDAKPSSIFGTLGLHANGNVANFNLGNAANIDLTGTVINWVKGEYWLYENGTLKDFKLLSLSVVFPFKSNLLALSDAGSFYPDGQPKDLTFSILKNHLQVNNFFLQKNGSKSRVLFWPTGLVKLIINNGNPRPNISTQDNGCSPNDKNICIQAKNIWFDEAGQITLARYFDALSFPTEHCQIATSGSFDDVDFYPTGIPKTFSIYQDIWVTGCVKDQRFTGLIENKQGFYPNGIIRSIRLSGDTSFKTADGTSKVFAHTCKVDFDEHGIASTSQPDCIKP